ncbi:C40 family peptidase [Lihuaxuella thermophila]|uniref:Cell wall-associated hydrolase, NlpC family n=1 Tax=Lihuaxuella thermophila TaxID=1173111 RepID=A0A1H8H694_9BACL|nr:C40 family peptidase [Lihuaxuella thermophila]SEN51494.1 Cell wall-associated hydrolase, NlpC family [Lihuaxuella thermophila]
MKLTIKWKKVVVASVALLLSTSILPLGHADAASKTLNSSQPYSLIESLFGKMGLGTFLNSKNTGTTKYSVTPVNAQPADSTAQQSNSSDQVVPKPNHQQAAGEETNTSWGDKIIATGEKYMGTPYKFGAPTTTTKVFDCSSFVKRVFAENGIDLPRTSRQQAEVGQEVSRSELQKGDLVFFKISSRPGIGHVGIYAGNGKLLHTWGPGGVRYDDMSDGWLDRGFVKATRVTPDTVK